MPAKKSTKAKTSNKNKITKEETAKGKALAIISYFGVLALIPYFAERKNKFVRFHAVQGMNLFLIELIVNVCLGMLVSLKSNSYCANNPVVCAVSGGFGVIGSLSFIYQVLWTVVLTLAILGIIYAAKGQAKELPIINKLKIVKK